MFDKYRANQITRIYAEKYAELKNLTSKDFEVQYEELKMDSLLNIFIEPTNRCNLSCSFCARENMKRDFHMLNMESFMRTVDSLPKGTYLTLTGNGEPTINVKIYDMIAYAAQKGMFVSIITNASALNEVNRQKLIDSGISRIQISFQALDKETDEKIMKGVVYERELLNILKLIYEIKTNKKNIFISITKVDIEESRKFAEVTKKFWERIPIDNYYEGKLLSLQTDSKKYENKQDEEYKPCASPWITVKVNANGEVNPCPHDFSSKFTIGNINDNSLLEILNSEKALQFRRASLLGDMDYLDEIGYCCKDCNTWKKEVNGNIEGFLECSFPVRMGLVINEIAGDRPTDTEFLEKAIKTLESGDLDLAALLSEE